MAEYSLARIVTPKVDMHCHNWHTDAVTPRYSLARADTLMPVSALASARYSLARAGTLMPLHLDTHWPGLAR